MAQLFFEKKAQFLGSWEKDNVDNAAIGDINRQIQNEKGSKVKLQLSKDGLRVVKNSVIQGKMLQDYISIGRIQFMTVSNRMPDLLIVIALSANAGSKFVIQAFRCKNSFDAAGYLNTCREIQKNIRPVQVVKMPPRVVAKEDEINWTLRSKEVDNSKRELKQFVNIHDEDVVVHQTETQREDDKKELFQNGHSEVYENGVRIPLYRKGKPNRDERIVSYESDVSDTRSEVSESALRTELESLSQELRDIKLMLEKSTGVAPESTTVKTTSGSQFEPVNVKVHKHMVRPETVVVERTENNMGAVVMVEDEEVQMRRPVQNGHVGYRVTSGENATHVRVSVPDYRTPTDRVSESGFSMESEPAEQNVGTVTSRTSRTSRTSMTSYDNWKKNTMERNVVRYTNDLPERVQWKSRASRQSYVVARPRSALPSWSADATDGSLVEVRHRTVPRQQVVVAPQYQRMTFVPRAKGQKSQSLRVKGMGSTVVKPIEKVYSRGGGGSVRTNSAHLRGSIIMDDASQTNGSQILYVEQNNNVVKTDSNDDLSLSVKDLEMYSETPAGGAVIHT